MTTQTIKVQFTQRHSFDLCRLADSEKNTGVAVSTIREWFAMGLRRYKCGSCVFFSYSELEVFIKEMDGKHKPELTAELERS